MCFSIAIIARVTTTPFVPTCHRWNHKSVGTPCSDARSQRTISSSELGNLSSGILHYNPSASVGNAKMYGMSLATQLNDVCDENAYASTL